MTRPVILDDTDNRIQYTGEWVLSTRSPILGTQKFGPIYERTIHGLLGDSGSFSITFEGNSVTVFGSFATTLVQPGLDIICLVGDAVAQYNALPIIGDNQLLCSFDGLENGEHILFVHFSKPRNADTPQFWFDRLIYSPHDQAVLDGSRQVVMSNDPDLVISSGWDETNSGYSGQEMTTNTNGSRLSFSFTGTSLTWIGSIQPNTLANSSLVYTIDGLNPTFVLLDLLASNTTQFNQTLFRLSSLPPEAHTLDVVYTGSNDALPLSLDYLYISPRTSLQSNSEGMQQGTIGGVLGLLVLLLSGFIIFNWRRWRAGSQHPKSSRNLGANAKPEDLVFPFTPLTSTVALPSPRERKRALSAPPYPSSESASPTIVTSTAPPSEEGPIPGPSSSSKPKKVKKAVRFGSNIPTQRVEREEAEREETKKDALQFATTTNPSDSENQQ